jgi:hypothetical protein
MAQQSAEQAPEQCHAMAMCTRWMEVLKQSCMVNLSDDTMEIDLRGTVMDNMTSFFLGAVYPDRQCACNCGFPGVRSSPTGAPASLQGHATCTYSMEGLSLGQGLFPSPLVAAGGGTQSSTDANPAHVECAVCHRKPGDPGVPAILKLCGGCLTARYCSTECQRQD